MQTRIADAVTVAVFILAGVLAVVMLIDVTFDPATCFGSCS
tara:strand:- start:2310 stop:2432 length:123 start_codon:yes stop_codon:yes gene_type:complete